MVIFENLPAVEKVVQEGGIPEGDEESLKLFESLEKDMSSLKHWKSFEYQA